MVEKVTSEKGKLNYGCYTSFQQRKINLSLLFSGFGFGLLLAFTIIFDLSFILMLIVGVIMFFLIQILVANKNNVLMNILNEFYDTLDYETCEKKIIELYKQPLHSETRKQLMLHQVNLLFVIDLNRATEIFNLIEVPKIKSNLGFYKVIETILKINKNEIDKQILEETISNLEKEYTDYFNKQSIKHIKRLYEIVYTNKEISDIELFDNKNMKRFVKILNYEKAMKYYYVRGNTEKAKKYANLISEFNTNFNELNKDVQEVLNDN